MITKYGKMSNEELIDLIRDRELKILELTNTIREIRKLAMTYHGKGIGNILVSKRSGGC